MAQPLSPLSEAYQNLRMLTIARNGRLDPTKSSSDAFDQVENISNASNYSHKNTDSKLLDDDSQASSLFRSAISYNEPVPKASQSLNKQRSPARTDGNMELTEKALKENEGYGRARQYESTNDGSRGHDTLSMVSGVDDTCFSTFSAVQEADMTALTRAGPLGKSSPAKGFTREVTRTPRHSRPTTPGTAREDYYGSPTPKRIIQESSDDTTNLLLEYTEQLSAYAPSANRSPTRPGHLSPAKSQTDISNHRLRSPTREGRHMPTNHAHLLDFDLPPAPTPRSVPTITPRELSQLKSDHLLETTSLKASISDRDVKIQVLTESKDTTKTRLEEVEQQSREFCQFKDALLAEKAAWEVRAQETQSVLRDVRGQIQHSDREREFLLAKNSDVSSRLEDAESRATSAEVRVSALEASLDASLATSNESAESSTTVVSTTTALDVTPFSGANRAVEMAVDKVARELHALYKAKHETKVGALKKSYEARWEKRVRELQARVDALARDNEDLKLGRDASMTDLMPQAPAPAVNSRAHEQHAHEAAAVLAERQILELALADQANRAEKMLQHIDLVQRERNDALAELENSRQEYSDLVAMVDEMLALEAANPATADDDIADILSPDSRPVVSSTSTIAATTALTNPPPFTTRAAAAAGAATAASSTGKLSGLRGPGFRMGESRIGMGMGMGIGNGLGAGTGIKRRTSGVGVATGGSLRSGIMGNIERMGRGRAAE